MASSQEPVAQQLLRCYHCGLESTESSFKYFDNKKVDQPRYKCHHCHKFFTLGAHGRPQGKTYKKKRNEDPDELKTLSRQCRHCGVADNSRFKYYNNHNLSQPRFQCLSCKNHFQMRVLGTDQERRLVHTSFQQRSGSAPRRQKIRQGVSDEPFPRASIGSEDGSYQPYDGSFLPVPSDPMMPCESSNMLCQDQMNGEDLQTFANFLEKELTERAESTYEENFTSWTGIGDSTDILPPLSSEDAQLLDLLEPEPMMPEENNDSAPNDDTCCFESNVITNTLQLPSARCIEDAELMGFSEVDVMDNTNEALLYNVDVPVSDNMAGEMVSEFASNCDFGEVMCGTLAPSESRPVAALFSDPEWASSTQNDVNAPADFSFTWSYADDAAPYCRQVDVDMAAEKNFMAHTAPCH